MESDAPLALQRGQPFVEDSGPDHLSVPAQHLLE
jgi:hypothetical protein